MKKTMDGEECFFLKLVWTDGEGGLWLMKSAK